MVRELTEQLEDLKEDLINMGIVIKNTIEKSIEALKKQDLQLAEKIISADDQIDDLEIELKEKCQKLLTYDKLSDEETRTILVISETATDLERIGDHCENIAEMVQKIGIQPFIKPLIDIPRMTDQVTKMLTGSLDIFVNKDIDQAKSLAKEDEFIDNLNEQIFRELLSFMMESPASIGQASALIFISRFLERIGDHCTNICEGVIYMISGRRESY